MEYVSHTIEPVATEPRDWTGGFDTVIVTSQTAVERIARDAAHAEAFGAVLESATLIAVGEATAELLRLHGYEPDDVAAGSARSVLEGLSASAAGRRVLWPSGAEASLDLVSLLGERGARVRRVVLYRKQPTPQGPGLSAEVLVRRPAAFCATSPAAADWLFAGLTPEAARAIAGNAGRGAGLHDARTALGAGCRARPCRPRGPLPQRRHASRAACQRLGRALGCCSDVTISGDPPPPAPANARTARPRPGDAPFGRSLRRASLRSERPGPARADRLASGSRAHVARRGGGGGPAICGRSASRPSFCSDSPSGRTRRAARPGTMRQPFNPAIRRDPAAPRRRWSSSPTSASTSTPRTATAA